MKKWTIYPISITVVLLLLLGAFWMYTHSKGFSRETLEMARVASDGGREIEARPLFKEACDEGNAEACQVVRDESDPGIRAAEIRDAKKACDAQGEPAVCRSAHELEILDRNAKVKK